MITIRNERQADAGPREALLDLAYGVARYAKPSHKLREGRSPADGLSLVAMDNGRIVGTLRLWQVTAGAARSALLLGPLAVHPEWRNEGIGSALMRRAVRLAALRGHGAVLLVGDACYYGRFGFSAEKTGGLRMMGQREPHRLLAVELQPGALDGVQGRIAATGKLISDRTRRPTAKAVEALQPGTLRPVSHAA
jgi:predicted N-acetyltransferase YhbS